MKLVIVGIVIVVAVLGIVASQLGGEFETVDEIIPAVTDVDDTLVVSNVDVASVVDENLDCMGTAKCFAGIVSEIIDGDTLKVNGESIRFSLTSAPELKGFGGVESKNFIETICPVGSTVVVDEDDGQVLGSYGRIIALVYCNDVILNQELLDANLGYLEERFCDSSEFEVTTWAQKHGCASGN
ncbi:MAG: thermonuclease family protein [Robiginitomaculum sp.]|nr:thermonuclease family protein [Robiginitomaculum sp.]